MLKKKCVEYRFRQCDGGRVVKAIDLNLQRQSIDVMSRKFESCPSRLFFIKFLIYNLFILFYIGVTTPTYIFL